MKKNRTNLFLSTLLLLSLLLLIPAVEGQALTKGKITEKRYSLARALQNKLLFSPQHAADRKNWLITAKTFSQAYKTDPYDSLAPSSLLTLGDLYFQMYKRFNKQDDLHEALAYYDDIVTLFPQHRFADDALYKTAKIYAVELKDLKNASLVFARLIAIYPKGDMISKAASDLKALKRPPVSDTKQPEPLIKRASSPPEQNTEPATIVGTKKKSLLSEVVTLRHWSTKSYTRVVIETSEPIIYTGHLLKQEGDKPRRLYVNLSDSKISKKLQQPIPIKDGLLQRIRSAQFSPDTVRVVLDTQSLSDYKIFHLEDPYRIVIDVKGAELPPQAPPTQFVSIPNNTPSLAQQLGLGIKRVVLDPGHGGKDPGAVGIGGLLEKDVVLKVAKKVARKITKELGIEVVLTRKHDVFLRLEERTAIANTEHGDLFISIHANSAKSPEAKGIETYYLDLATNEDEMKIAAKENATAAQKISDLQNILSSLMNNSKKNESAQLAKMIQSNLYKGLNDKFKDIRNHGVKKAPFIVLIGAQMPSILTEIAFISNPQEAERMVTDHYLEAIADSITRGIVEYAVTLKVAGL
nr:N-acetylmuramoyl-L-alanine amidase [Desulfobulbaceae bacterium]